jgi:hypothetical protein
MPWLPQPTITVNGTSRNSITLTDVQISYGRSSVWEQARSSYARIAIINNSSTDFAFDMNQTVSVKVKNVAGTDVTVFTGKITSVDNALAGSGSIGSSVVQTITAVGPFSQMSRKIIGTANWHKEMDTDRMTRIFTDAGQTIDVVDSPAIYEFAARSANPEDSYTLAAAYAQQANGYIYETTDGEVGFANESRRFIDQRDNGYLVIPNNYILWGSVSSQKTLADIVNAITVTSISSSASASDATSQGIYGVVAGSISTELHKATDAQIQADRYVTLRAYPRTSLSSFTIPVNNPNVSSANVDKFISMTVGKPIEISTLPTGIKNTVYRGFVEGYSFSINQYEMVMNLITTDYTYSITPTRWQDVSASLTWAGVGSTVQWTTYDDI